MKQCGLWDSDFNVLWLWLFAEQDFLKDYVNNISVLEICPSQEEMSYNCSRLMRLATACDK